MWSGPEAVEHKDVRGAPPRLFSKDTLARRCAKRFGWDPQHTAGLTQELYDEGYFSYPRTESEHLPEWQAGDAAAIVTAIVTVLTDVRDVVPAGEVLLIRRGAKGHYVKDPGEHHAIVPLRKVPERSQGACRARQAAGQGGTDVATGSTTTSSMKRPQGMIKSPFMNRLPKVDNDRAAQSVRSVRPQRPI